MQVHGANCYISSTEPGRFEVIKYSPEEIRDAWQAFKESAGYSRDTTLERLPTAG